MARYVETPWTQNMCDWATSALSAASLERPSAMGTRGAEAMASARATWGSPARPFGVDYRVDKLEVGGARQAARGDAAASVHGGELLVVVRGRRTGGARGCAAGRRHLGVAPRRGDARLCRCPKQVSSGGGGSVPARNLATRSALPRKKRPKETAEATPEATASAADSAE